MFYGLRIEGQTSYIGIYTVWRYIIRGVEIAHSILLA